MPSRTPFFVINTLIQPFLHCIFWLQLLLLYSGSECCVPRPCPGDTPQSPRAHRETRSKGGAGTTSPGSLFSYSQGVKGSQLYTFSKERQTASSPSSWKRNQGTLKIDKEIEAYPSLYMSLIVYE